MSHLKKTVGDVNLGFSKIYAAEGLNLVNCSLFCAGPMLIKFYS